MMIRLKLKSLFRLKCVKYGHLSLKCVKSTKPLKSVSVMRIGDRMLWRKTHEMCVFHAFQWNTSISSWNAGSKDLYQVWQFVIKSVDEMMQIKIKRIKLCCIMFISTCAKFTWVKNNQQIVCRVMNYLSLYEGLMLN